MEKYLQSINKNNCQPTIMYPANLSFKNEREINSLTDNRKEGRREGEGEGEKRRIEA